MTELLMVAGLGGLLALDATSVGQFMVSRPLVAGTLAGWMLGDLESGVLIGGLLELYLLVSVPTGGARFPEGATATVVAVASTTAGAGMGTIPLAVATGLLWGQLGGVSITWQRELAGRFIPEPSSVSAGAGRVVAAHLGAVALDFLRGALITFLGAMAGRRVVAELSGAWPMGAPDSEGLLMLGGAVSAGILLRSMGGFRRRGVLFAAGLVLGVLGARFL